MEPAKDLCSQAQIQGQIVADLPIVLRKETIIVGAILVVIHTAAAKTELRCPEQKILKVRCRRRTERPVRRSVREKELTIEYLWEELVEIHPRELPSEAEHVCTLYPAHGVHEIVVVLRLVLVPKRRRTDLEAGAGKNEFVNGLGHRSGRPEDADVVGGHRVHIVQLIVDVHEAEPEFVHQRRRKEMRFRGVEETRAHRRVEREIQRRRADAAGQRAAERFLEVASPKRQETFRIREEKTHRYLVLAAAEFPVPVRGELVVCKFSGLTQGEGPGIHDSVGQPWRARNGAPCSNLAGRDQEPALRSELSRSVEPLQQPCATAVGKNGIDAGETKNASQASRRAIRRQERDI